MIYIGIKDDKKHKIIQDYIKIKNITKTFVISPKKFLLNPEFEEITYEDSIEYVVFYKMLQEVDENTLIVVNECLRTQNRYSLNYNCIRNFLNQTKHQIIFQQLPQIDTREDFMILFDFDTQSKWKRDLFNVDLIKNNSNVYIDSQKIMFTKVNVSTINSTIKKYNASKNKLFSELGNRDPHILPRRLYLIAGNDKKRFINRLSELPMFSDGSAFVARGKRLKHALIHSYNDVDISAKYSILEFQHRFIDFSDFIKQTNQFEFDVLVTQLKVDEWYFNRYNEWGIRINETCANLQ